MIVHDTKHDRKCSFETKKKLIKCIRNWKISFNPNCSQIKFKSYQKMHLLDFLLTVTKWIDVKKKLEISPPNLLGATYYWLETMADNNRGGSSTNEITYYLNVENAKILAFCIVCGFVMYHGVLHLKYG